MKDYAYAMEMSVRAYECDMQGIVNNAVYHHYLEHARQMYLMSIGLDFIDYAKRGINFVLTHVELDYKQALTAGDKFVIGLNIERISRIKYAFHEEIYRLSDKKTIITAKVVATALNAKGRPEIPQEVETVLSGHAVAV